MTPDERLEAIGALAARDPRIEAAFNLLDGKLDAAVRAAETELAQTRELYEHDVRRLVALQHRTLREALITALESIPEVLAAAYPELPAGTHWLAPREMTEAAARAVCELDPQSPGPDEPIMIGSKRAKAWEPRAEIIREAIKLGLFAWPPKAWLAPMEATPSIAEALNERRRADDLWSTDELWSAARDAYLREGGK